MVGSLSLLLVTVAATAVGMVLAGTPAAWAGRPLATEDAGTLDPGQVELELGVDYVREPDRTEAIPASVSLNIGLLPRLEGTVATAIVGIDPPEAPARAGPGDTVGRLKYRLLDETSATPALAGGVALRLPSGDANRGLGARGVDVHALAIVAKTFATTTTLTLNAGYTFVTHDRDGDVVNASASIERAIDAWTIVGEVVGEVSSARRADDRVLVRVGTVYAVSERVRLDAAGAFGVTRASPDFVLTLGLTVLLHSP